MSFYDELERKNATDPFTTQLDAAMERYEEKFGVAPMIPVEMSFSREGLVRALNEAVESEKPGVFKA